jgi:arylsulfatase
MPTLCDIADIEPPSDIDGISFKSALLGEEQKPHEFLYWEFPSYKGQQAVRLGKWKGVRKNIFDGNLDLELYNLDNDLLEQNNLAEQNPEIVERIANIMVQEHEPSENERFKIKQLGDK